MGGEWVRGGDMSHFKYSKHRFVTKFSIDNVVLAAREGDSFNVPASAGT
jgi:hypothetical protein